MKPIRGIYALFLSALLFLSPALRAESRVYLKNESPFRLEVGTPIIAGPNSFNHSRGEAIIMPQEDKRIFDFTRYKGVKKDKEYFISLPVNLIDPANGGPAATFTILLKLRGKTFSSTLWKAAEGNGFKKDWTDISDTKQIEAQFDASGASVELTYKSFLVGVNHDVRYTVKALNTQPKPSIPVISAEDQQARELLRIGAVKEDIIRLATKLESDIKELTTDSLGNYISQSEAENKLVILERQWKDEFDTLNRTYKNIFSSSPEVEQSYLEATSTLRFYFAAAEKVIQQMDPRARINPRPKPVAPPVPPRPEKPVTPPPVPPRPAKPQSEPESQEQKDGKFTIINNTLSTKMWIAILNTQSARNFDDINISQLVSNRDTNFKLVNERSTSTFYLYKNKPFVIILQREEDTQGGEQIAWTKMYEGSEQPARIMLREGQAPSAAGFTAMKVAR